MQTNGKLQVEWKSLVYRKIVAAALAACLFAIVFSFAEPSLYHSRYASIANNLVQAKLSVSVYLLYAYPVILVYGGGTSLASECAVIGLVRCRLLRSNAQALFTSAVLHLLFGLILYQASLLSAALYFASDWWLSGLRTAYGAKAALLSVLLPAGLFLVALI